MYKIFNKIKKFNNKIALVNENNEKISYKELIKESNKIIHKVKSNSVVLLVADNNINFVKGYVAFLRKKKLISILIDNSTSIDFVKKIYSIYKPNYVFSPLKFTKIFNDNKILIRFTDYAIYETSFVNKKLNFKNYLLLSTSGTTQSPKFVRLSAANFEDNTKKIVKHLNITGKQTTITTMPMGYSYGLSIINTHLSTGAKIVINNKSIFEKKFWDILNNFKVNSFGGVPEFYEFLQRIDFKKRSVESLKYLTQAGGKINISVLKYFINACELKNIKFIVMYGQTEASPRITYLNWNKLNTKIGSVGKPLSGYKLFLKDGRGKKIIKTETKGELILSGKNVCLGYANNLQDLKKGDLNKGKLNTGDIARIDKEGYLFIVGRKDRYIKIFGKRCNLDDIEKYLKKKKIKAKCYYDKKNIVVSIKKKFSNDKIKEILGSFLGINTNFITIKENYLKSLKEY